MICEIASNEKEPQKYKGIKQGFKSATTELNSQGQTVDVPNYAFLIFDVSKLKMVTKLQKKRNGFRIVPLSSHVHFEKDKIETTGQLAT